MNTATTPKPDDYTFGLGELIRAHRLYVGLSQRDMAERLNKDRRDYQRIENGQDACPPGLLSRIEEMTDKFDTHVDAVIEHAKHEGGVVIKLTAADLAPGQDWDRNVAGRAALYASGEPEGPPITFHIDRSN